MAASVQLSFADLETVEEAGPINAPAAPDAIRSVPATSAWTADRAALAALEAALLEAREAADDRPPLVVLAACLGQLGSPPSTTVVSLASLRQPRDDWLRRLETGTQERERARRVPRCDRRSPRLVRRARAERPQRTSDRRLPERLRSNGPIPRPRRTTAGSFSFVAFSDGQRRRDGLPDPFLDLEPPPKPRQERDWLTPEEFRKLLDAASHPQRNLPGLAERDRLALLALVTTGLRPLRALRARVARSRP